MVAKWPKALLTQPCFERQQARRVCAHNVFIAHLLADVLLAAVTDLIKNNLDLSVEITLEIFTECLDILWRYSDRLLGTHNHILTKRLHVPLRASGIGCTTQAFHSPGVNVWANLLLTLLNMMPKWNTKDTRSKIWSWLFEAVIKFHDCIQA